MEEPVYLTEVKPNPPTCVVEEERKDTLRMYLEWEGIIGYTEKIWRIFEASRSELSKIRDNIERQKKG